jgi:hypothetical protein
LKLIQTLLWLFSEPYASYSYGPSFGCGVAALCLGLISTYIKGAVVFMKYKQENVGMVSLEKEDDKYELATANVNNGTTPVV